jgi:hypothetical protein
MNKKKKFLSISFFIISVIIISNLFSYQENDKLQAYIDFLETCNTNSENYIINLFRDYDIVILYERFHMETVQYNLINRIVNNPDFINNVGNICTEIGASNYSDSLNNYLKYNTDDTLLGFEKLLQFHREISFYSIWNKINYQMLLKNIFIQNKKLEDDKKINLHISDIPWNWGNIKNKDDYKQSSKKPQDRNSIIGNNIITSYEKILKKSKRKKMLVILNDYHAIANIKWEECRGIKSASQYIAEKLGNEKIATVLLNTVSTENDKAKLIHNGYWDAAFEIVDKKDIAFDFDNSPFGLDIFDLVCGKNNKEFLYKDIFTGFLFYYPLKEHKLIFGVPGIINDNFRTEFLRRIKITDPNYYDKIKKDTVLAGWNTLIEYNYKSLGIDISPIDSIVKNYNSEKIKNINH